MGMEGLTTRHVLVAALIYSTAFIPWILLFVLTKKKLWEQWILRTVSICTLICAFGWEIWFTYGLLGGDPVDQRRPEPLNNLMPKHINWVLNSLADGSICMVAILLMFLGSIFFYFLKPIFLYFVKLNRKV